ncbi:hypothetical protein ACFL1R_07060 [Candidatus Latescibacterota bacterium]
MQSPLKRSFAAEELRKRQQRKKPWLWMAAGAMLVALVIGGYALYTRFGVQEKSVPSIAVLPFINMSTDPDQVPFCDGMSEEIINALTNVGGLRVIARTSAFFFKGKDYKIQDVGKELNVETVLEGSVRKADNQLRITAQLINVADESHLWSDTYNRELEDVFAIQEEISLAIVEALKVKLLDKEKAAIEKRYTEDTDAYQLYLLGRHYWNLRSGPQKEEMLRKGLDYFQQAIKKDPDYALAYTGIADSYHQLGFFGYMPSEEAYRKGKEAVEKALELDDTLSEVHVTLGWIGEFKDMDFPAAGREYKLAVELNPNSVNAHYYYGGYLQNMGRYNESLDEAKRARMLDPLDPRNYRDIADNYWHMGRYDEAIKECYKGIEIFPEYGWLYNNLILILCEQGKYNEALKAVQLARVNLGNSTRGERLLGSIYALSGERAKAEQIIAKLQIEGDLVSIAYIYIDLSEKEKAEGILQELIEQSKKGIITPRTIARIYTYWGEFDKAVDWMEKAYEEQPHETYHGLRFIILNNIDILSHPRYKALLKKMGLPE